MYWTITNLIDAKGLAAKMRSDGLKATQRGNIVIVESEDKPWARLAGHMTNSTDIIPGPSFNEALNNIQ